MSAAPQVTGRKIRRHHLDRRAESIEREITAADVGDGLFDTRQVAAILGVSPQWLEVGRSKAGKYGPPFVPLSERMIRYRRDDLLRWIRSRKAIDPAR